jgi:translation elongation factor EF-4
MADLKFQRNFGIAAHIDAGKPQQRSVFCAIPE